VAQLGNEAAQVARLTQGLAKRTFVAPWVVRPPEGLAALHTLVDGPGF
jgi:arsenite/tail-anchored protein-transporting ATPase